MLLFPMMFTEIGLCWWAWSVHPGLFFAVFWGSIGASTLIESENRWRAIRKETDPEGLAREDRLNDMARFAFGVCMLAGLIWWRYWR